MSNPFVDIQTQLTEIKSLISQILNQKQAPPRLLSVTEAADYLKVKKQTVYQWVWKNEIPVIKNGKRLLFELDALNLHLNSRKRKTWADFIQN